MVVSPPKPRAAAAAKAGEGGGARGMVEVDSMSSDDFDAVFQPPPRPAAGLGALGTSRLAPRTTAPPRASPVRSVGRGAAGGAAGGAPELHACDSIEALSMGDESLDVDDLLP